MGDRNETELNNALSVLRADYYQSVRATGDDLLRRMRAKEWDDEESMRDSVREETDQTYWDIYTHASYQCLQASDNHANAWEEMQDMCFDFSKGGYPEPITVAACVAHRLDVEEYIESDLKEYFETLAAGDEPVEAVDA